MVGETGSGENIDWKLVGNPQVFKEASSLKGLKLKALENNFPVIVYTCEGPYILVPKWFYCRRRDGSETVFIVINCTLSFQGRVFPIPF